MAYPTFPGAQGWASPAARGQGLPARRGEWPLRAARRLFRGVSLGAMYVFPGAVAMASLGAGGAQAGWPVVAKLWPLPVAAAPEC